jgi:predicted HicB family RNase H-like nuclease|tara:strand:- start:192 stop:662 length:471 start_codon:yes stop_codon:yes gene_type:complete
MNASEYNIIVRQGTFEGEVCFEARVTELPDVAEYADTYQEAYELAIDTIETTSEMLGEQGKVMPLPYVPETDYSGRVTLRMAKSLHRRVSEISADEGVSVNQLIVTALSYHMGSMVGKRRKVVGGGWSEEQRATSPYKRHLTLVSSQDLNGEVTYQ